MSASERIYLDHHATTPCDPRVVEAMLPYLRELFGNAASRTHVFGWQAGQAVDAARAEVAALIGARASEIVFTSGATEANNLAIRGLALGMRDRGDHVITCETEHRSVLDPCLALEKQGFRVTRVPVDPEGRVDLEQVEAAIEPGTVLISLMHANNEIGVIHDIAAVGRLARSRGIALHTDAAQSVGKIGVDVGLLGVDLLSFTAHKLYGPQGIGALYVRGGGRDLRIEPLLYGGGHERGLRSGTLPVPLCAGFGEACRIARSRLETEPARLRDLADGLRQGLLASLPGVRLNGPVDRLPGNLNLSFEGVEAEALLLRLPDLALSTGSACTSSKPEPSHVLRAIGLSPALSMASVRFGLGRFNTADEIDRAAAQIVDQVEQLRALSSPRRRWPAGSGAAGMVDGRVPPDGGGRTGEGA